jgi:hypothetical protein
MANKPIIMPDGVGFGDETLSKYDEGTWVPTGNGVTYSSASGYYIRVGNTVYISFDVTFPATADTSAIQFNGLPFAHGAGVGSAISVAYSTQGTAHTVRIDPSANRCIISDYSGNTINNVSYSAKRLICSGTYRIA